MKAKLMFAATLRLGPLVGPLAGLLVCVLGGCYQEILSAVVDPTGTTAAGTMTAQLGEVMAGSVPGLAKSDPLVITGSSSTNPNLIISMTAGVDAAGADSYATLAVANASITLPIDANSVSNLQVHYLGATCQADSGTIVLATDGALLIDGTFTATGHDPMTGAACATNGSLTSVPQSR